MSRLLIGILIASAAFATAYGQGEEGAPLPVPTAPVFPTTPSLPPRVGPNSRADDVPGARMPPPGVPARPGASGPVGAPPMPPPVNPNMDQVPPRDLPQASAARQAPAEVRLISFLDSTAPFVQAFDFVLMLIAGVFCWRARRAPGLTILAISCLVSAIILLGFFLFGVLSGHGTFAQTVYIIARILAPFELLLFAIGLVLVARPNRR